MFKKNNPGCGNAGCGCQSCTKGPEFGTTCSLVVNGTTVDEIIWEIVDIDDPFVGGISPVINYFEITGLSALIGQYVADLSALGNSAGCIAFKGTSTVPVTYKFFSPEGEMTDSGSGTCYAEFAGGSDPAFTIVLNITSGPVNQFVWSTVNVYDEIDICFELPDTELTSLRGSSVTLKMTHGFDP